MKYMDRISIAKKLKSKRLALNYSQEVVAKAIGLTPSQYSRIENTSTEKGKFSDLSLSTLLKIIAFLKINLSDLEDGQKDLPRARQADLQGMVDKRLEWLEFNTRKLLEITETNPRQLQPLRDASVKIELLVQKYGLVGLEKLLTCDIATAQLILIILNDGSLVSEKDLVDLFQKLFPKKNPEKLETSPVSVPRKNHKP